MRIRLLQLAAGALLAGTLGEAAAQADAYPSKPIRIITHSAAGGAPDVMLRIVGDRLGALIGPADRGAQPAGRRRRGGGARGRGRGA